MDQSCWNEIHQSQPKYLLSGSEQSGKVGARLWNLDAIKPAWLKKTGSPSCIDKIFKQAVDDQREYWEYIGRHHQCGKDSASAAPESTCGRYAFNMSYLGFTGKVLSALEAESKGGPCAPNTHPAPIVNQLGKDLAKIAATPPAKKSAAQKAIDDKCYMVPESQRRKAEEETFSNLMSYTFSKHQILDCGVGIIKQLMIELDGLKAVAGAVVKFKDKTKADMAKVGWMTGLANASRAVYDKMTLDPVKLAHDATMGAWRYATENFDNINCYSNEEQSIRVCQLIPKIALVMLTGEVLKPAYALVGRAVGAVGDATTAVGVKAATAAAGTRVGQAYLAGSDAIEAAVKAGAKKAAESKAGKVAISITNGTKKAAASVAKGAVKGVTAPVRLPARYIANKLKKGRAAPAPTTNAGASATAGAGDATASSSTQGAAQGASQGAQNGAATQASSTTPSTTTQAGNTAQSSGATAQTSSSATQNGVNAADNAAEGAAAEGAAEGAASAEAAKRGVIGRAAHAGSSMTGKVLKVGTSVAPARKLEDAHEERPSVLQPKIDEATAEFEKGKKEAAERWKKAHPNGDEPEWTPPAEETKP